MGSFGTLLYSLMGRSAFTISNNTRGIICIAFSEYLRDISSRTRSGNDV